MKQVIRILMLGLCAVMPALAVAAPESGKVISIELNKGKMVRLPSMATSVMIANPTVADIQIITPHLVYVYAKQIGQTSLFAIDNGDNTLLDTTIDVTHDISKLSATLKEMVPNADINLTTVDGGLVMNGYVDSPIESQTVKNIAATFIGKEDKLVDLISTAGSHQVMLMVKVAEVNRNELKRFGINILSTISSGNFLFSMLRGRYFYDDDGLIPQNRTAAGLDNQLYGAWTGGNKSVDALIDALENQGLVSILAEPNLTTASGKTANFLAGGEFPVPIIDSDGRVNIVYKPYGISLNFTPVVLEKDKISLEVAPEVSNIAATQGLTLGNNQVQFTVPTLETRKAQTTVELASGQTFAIAGLLKNDRANNVDKFPGLGDMPVLGALFRSHEFRNNQSELVILVTPYIVRGVDQRAKTQSPLDGYVPPNDLQRLLWGNLYQRKQSVSGITQNAESYIAADVPPLNAPTLHGQGGFMLQ